MTRTVPLALLLAASSLACGGDDEPDFIGGPDDNYAGIVEGSNGPVSGAMVTVPGSAVSTTTNSAGLFALELPLGDTTVLVSAAGYWGDQRRIRLGGPQRILDAEIELISDSDVASIETELGIAINAAAGVVIMPFFSSDNIDLTGVGAQVSSTSESPFTFNMDDALVPSTVLLAGGTEQELIFMNVALGPTTATASGSSTVVCSTEFDSAGSPFFVQAKVVSEIRVFCATASRAQ